MKYWLFLLLKLAAAALLSGGLLWTVNLFWSPRTPFFYLAPFLFGFDLLYTTVAGLVFLAAYGLVYLAILDQRYRCRVCLRRLQDAGRNGVLEPHVAIRTSRAWSTSVLTGMGS